jgi:hypothetical protein
MAREKVIKKMSREKWWVKWYKNYKSHSRQVNKRQIYSKKVEISKYGVKEVLI